nr:uncharacterized protein CTRU02_07840 [Colletotrichum truncatum]KAF6790934.1 hypothetical protein CTRU02_07840 [Colletotrichum truncatum]
MKATTTAIILFAIVSSSQAQNDQCWKAGNDPDCTEEPGNRFQWNCLSGSTIFNLPSERRGRCHYGPLVGNVRVWCCDQGGP